MRTWQIKAEADLPARDTGLRVSWEPRLGEPAGLRAEWCAFLADKYDQPVGGVQGGRSRPIGELLADTRRQNIKLWVSFPRTAAGDSPLRCAEFKMQRTADEEEWAVVVEAIRREHSLEGGVARFAYGSVPVFAIGGGHVVKLFPPAQRAYFDTERAALERVEGHLPIPTPRVLGAGETGSWLYLVMTRLPGRPMVEEWPEIGMHDRLGLMREVGAALAALHATPAHGLESLVVDWPRFMESQRASCQEQQRSRGLQAPWADAVGGFLARWAPGDDGARALLHTELTREHLLVQFSEGAWHASGLFDFEDALFGQHEYEFACAGIFLACAEPGLVGALLDAYGADVDEEFPMRIMAYVLLHRYSDLRWYLERLPVPCEAGDLESLARAWFTP